MVDQEIPAIAKVGVCGTYPAGTGLTLAAVEKGAVCSLQCPTIAVFCGSLVVGYLAFKAGKIIVRYLYETEEGTWWTKLKKVTKDEWESTFNLFDEKSKRCLTDIQKQLTDAYEQMKTTNEENGAMRVKVNEMMIELTEVRTELTETRNKNMELHEKLDGMTIQLNESIKENQRLHEKVDAITAQLNKSRKENQEIKQQMSKIADYFQKLHQIQETR